MRVGMVEYTGDLLLCEFWSYVGYEFGKYINGLIRIDEIPAASYNRIDCMV